MTIVEAIHNETSHSAIEPRPHSTFVENHVKSGKWRLERIPAYVVGLSRDLDVYRAKRSTSFITEKQDNSDAETFCPAVLSDLIITSGPCGLACRGCCVFNTFRRMRDPLRPLLHDNVEDAWRETRKWLVSPDHKPGEPFGIGIDKCDSLLFEGVLGHARELIPIFANPELNPKGHQLLLLTKTANVHYLEGLPNKNVAVAFSLNPEPIADLWEGKWPDTLERITPAISDRLQACLNAQQMGYQTRWRLDPILYPQGWQTDYEEFFREAAGLGLQPRLITLGTYREIRAGLDKQREYWRLPVMEWSPDGLTREGTHLRAAGRVDVYRTVIGFCREYFPDSAVGLCKETHAVRKQLGVCKSCCNCMCIK